jgi:hypothetical protein
MILKFIQFLFKFLATIFSKLGAQYTYTKLFKSLMKYKIISILYDLIKFIKIAILFYNNKVSKKYFYLKDNPIKISRKSYLLKITIFYKKNNKEGNWKEF